MTRLLKILAYAVILFLLYLVMTGFLKSCNSKKQVAAAAMENDYNAPGEDEFYTEDEFKASDNELFADNITDDVEGINYDKINEAVERRTESATQPITKIKDETKASIINKEPTTSVSSSSDGSFMVIAGNYIINTNAENMVLDLKKKGYKSAEIVIFDMSQYHSVVANRYDSYSSAYNLVKELEAKGVDSYVHRKK